VSNECVRRLKLKLRELGCELIVATPASSEVSTTSVCVGCPMEVAGCKFKVNLICLPMEGLDMIVRQPYCHRLRMALCGIPRDNRTGVDLSLEGDEGS